MEAKLLVPIGLQNMHIFYDSMQLMAIATDESVRLLVQIPLKTEQSTYTVYEAILIPTFQPDIQNFMQIGRTREWFMISTDFRNYLRLDLDYITSAELAILHSAIFGGLFWIEVAKAVWGDCSSGSQT
jgi:hypothetical protein